MRQVDMVADQRLEHRLLLGSYPRLARFQLGGG